MLVRRSLEGLQTIGDALGDTLELDWLKAGVRRVRERFETDRKEADVVSREFLGWLAQRPQPERPFFAFLNYCDAHTPYQLSPRRVHRFGVKPSDEREFRLIQEWWTMDKSRLAPQDLAFIFDAYDDCVAWVDEQLGRLFDELERRKALDRTWVILVSDHGESFGEHAGVYLHGSSLYQTELHVPLVVLPPPGTPDQAGRRGDGQPPQPGRHDRRPRGRWPPTRPSPAHRWPGYGARRPVRRATPDPARTPWPSSSPTRRSMAGAPDPSRRPWPLAALAEGGWSYIRREGEVLEELYHLREDPREQHNIAASASSHPRTRADARGPVAADTRPVNAQPIQPLRTTPRQVATRSFIPSPLIDEPLNIALQLLKCRKLS